MGRVAPGRGLRAMCRWPRTRGRAPPRTWRRPASGTSRSGLFQLIPACDQLASDGQSWAAAGGADLQMMGPILVRDGGSKLTAIDMMQGLVVSHDRGKTWQTVGPGFQQMWVAVDPNAPQHLVAAGNGVIS